MALGRLISDLTRPLIEIRMGKRGASIAGFA